ncbi:cellulose synthase-like protein E1 isoform X2 [Rhododendron vialii]|uniref:cellulose synthase-like protein E1 isoform X2 n=1 Tax=Rhododendron vialii TaxID=182163 RepID=UPI00265F5EF4|nr:cellulose synthase-like protein E1 isoform X2 [Rhododendron vialii]
MGQEVYLPLFETKAAKGRVAYKLYSLSVFVGIFSIWVFRAGHLPPAETERGRRWGWIGLSMAELWFSFYWFLTQFARWNPVYRSTFKHRLSQRYEKELPGVDVFVCTADPTIEPPIMVVNTVLSVMAYDYPPERLAVYLSDDAGSELTFYALLEASRFAKHWLPFCKKFKVEPRSPAAYFTTVDRDDQELLGDGGEYRSSVKKIYEEMRDRIDIATRLARIPSDIRNEHKGFCEWDLVSSARNHPAILQILIDGRETKVVGIENHDKLPTLVYLSREKRPHRHHNFKAGAMNALIRVSSKMSNGPIILNVDCDVYSNNSESVRDAMCFFMDENKGHEVAYVQYPQSYNNLTRNDLHGICFRVLNEVDLAAMDANGGPCYIGSGCFHRRESLCGMKYDRKECGGLDQWRKETDKNEKQSAIVLEDMSKVLANCTYEDNTQWGREMGVKYGFPAEDIITGLSIHCRGWKSIYFNPERKSFTGVAPTTLLQALVQQKRWSEGQFQIFLSKYCPLVYGRGRIPLNLRMCYAIYALWAPNCLPTLYYVIVPSLFLLGDVSLFPQITSLWILPFAYVLIAKYGCSLAEFITCGGTPLGWWNEQRIWVFRRTTSFCFAFLETIARQLGFTKLEFVVTAKVSDSEVYQRYLQETMEFGSPSPMFTVLSTIAMINLLSFVWGLKRMIMDAKYGVLEQLGLQIVLCGVIVLINLPVYKGLFFRRDKGKMPSSVMYKSVMLAFLACSIALYLV